MVDKEIIIVRERLTGLCYRISNFQNASLFKETQSQR